MKTTITALVAAILLLNSCATILDGNKTRIRVHQGVPAKAQVYSNGAFVGNAPATVKVKKQSLKHGATLEIKAEGYESQTIKLYRKPRWGFVALSFVSGGIPLIVDILNGNITGVRPKKVDYHLQKK